MHGFMYHYDHPRPVARERYEAWAQKNVATGPDVTGPSDRTLAWWRVLWPTELSDSVLGYAEEESFELAPLPCWAEHSAAERQEKAQ
ncbi:MAG: hypothetical protein K8J08_10265, partial [Thermoanaerobaculia bacterium]|nr:hypothetical protein [Thermoanaerobaculia bacterium]